ncbi:Gfo/Idh/MocA family oxidoreductase [Microbacterium sp. 4R-513]|uniref:Gfo/Idh/MocA family protein n=1 Tax=Microbacterium sp. 4R-513 TaxID=2567934 RepID=UPI0013E1B7E1|nr:Gfo/Idh/MocA family oxidoreductase [Microbacterium sp. 4R-513]QIG39559.1 Gfo/Idh/MocA family oxidoreductase [Microbacterium sp. 4R-513]
MGSAHRIGVVGLGFISKVYLETLTAAPDVEITAVADLDRSRADAAADALPSARARSVDELLAADDVDVVLNLTIPAAHADVALAAIAQGKDVYGEKPLAAAFADAQEILRAAEAAGVRVGCAPDTVLGTGLQTARAVVDAGEIGRPIAATAQMVTPGHERWHPNPDFYYQPGGGPLLDMGPYYVTALVQLLGPVESVFGAGSRLRSERIIGGGARAGEAVPVAVDSHVTGILEHTSGALSTITTTFDGTATKAPPIEVHGENGSLGVPDPNHFDGEVSLHELGGTGWAPVSPRAGVPGGARGIGLLDLLRAPDGVAPRASGEMALHALEIMTGLLDSAASGSRVTLTTTVERPPLVPLP